MGTTGTEGCSNMEFAKFIAKELDTGKYIFVACADYSEKYLCKRGSGYCSSTDRDFEEDVTSHFTVESLSMFLTGVRGYGYYVPDDYKYKAALMQ